jgi:hypothetical protein
LEEGTWEVRRGPKGMSDGGTTELTEGGGEWRGGGSSVDRRGHEAGEREEGGGGDGVLDARSRGRMKKGRSGSDKARFISDTAGSGGRPMGGAKRW